MYQINIHHDYLKQFDQKELIAHGITKIEKGTQAYGKYKTIENRDYIYRGLKESKALTDLTDLIAKQGMFGKEEYKMVDLRKELKSYPLGLLWGLTPNKRVSDRVILCQLMTLRGYSISYRRDTGNHIVKQVKALQGQHTLWDGTTSFSFARPVEPKSSVKAFKPKVVTDVKTMEMSGVVNLGCLVNLDIWGVELELGYFLDGRLLPQLGFHNSELIACRFDVLDSDKAYLPLLSQKAVYVYAECYKDSVSVELNHKKLAGGVATHDKVSLTVNAYEPSSSCGVYISLDGQRCL